MVRPTGSPITHQISVRDRRLQAFIGQLASEVDKIERNYVNEDPQAQQVSTIVADSFSAAADYIFSFNGVAFTMTEDGTGANVADVASQLVAFIESQGAISGFVTVVDDSVDTVTLTSRLSGYSFTLTDTDAKLTTATTTAAADADTVQFGRALARTGFAASGTLEIEDSIERAALAAVGLFTAQVDTWTVADPGTGQVLTASLSIDSLAESVVAQVATTGTLNTDLDNLAVNLNAALVDIGSDAYVTVAGPAGAPGAGELEFTAAIAGAGFTTMVTCDDSAGYPAITLASNKALSTALSRAFAGMARRVSDEEAALDFDNASTASYEANATMLVVERGEVWVDNADTLALGDQVFVDLTAAEGKFYNAAGANRVPLDPRRAEWVKSGRSLDNETLGLLRLL